MNFARAHARGTTCRRYNDLGLIQQFNNRVIHLDQGIVHLNRY